MSMLELKLDPNTMFEWQKESQHLTEIPHFQKLFDFINLWAQGSEVSVSDHKKAPRNEDHLVKLSNATGKVIASFSASATDSTSSPYIACKSEKHPLYACMQFKSLPHEQRDSLSGL